MRRFLIFLLLIILGYFKTSHAAESPTPTPVGTPVPQNVCLMHTQPASPVANERIRYVNTASSPGGDGTTNAIVGPNRAYSGIGEVPQAEVLAGARDLVADNVWLHVIFSGTVDNSLGTYYSTADWGLFITDPTHYVSLEVEAASRHAGVFDPTKYVILSWQECIRAWSGFQAMPGYPASEVPNNIRIEGFQCVFLNPNGDGPTSGISIQSTSPVSPMDHEVVIKDNIIVWQPPGWSYVKWGTGCAGGNGCSPYCINTNGHVTPGRPYDSRYWIVNNLCVGFGNGMFIAENYIATSSYETSVYNNTIECGRPDLCQKWGKGLDLFIFVGSNMFTGANDCLRVFNNVTKNCNSGFYHSTRVPANWHFEHGNNVSSDTTSFGGVLWENLTPVMAGEGRDDIFNLDLRLSGADTIAKDKGADLSLDPSYPFADDAVGTARPQGAVWDIGYFESLNPGLPAGTPTPTPTPTPSTDLVAGFPVQPRPPTFMPTPIDPGYVSVIPTPVPAPHCLPLEPSDPPGLTERTRYVNTASSPGGDGTTNAIVGPNRAYAGLVEAITQEVATAPDLVSDNVWLHIICSGTVDYNTGIMNSHWITGFTLDWNHYLSITVDPASRHQGVRDDSKYVFFAHDSGYALSTDLAYVRIEGLQVVLDAANDCSDDNFHCTVWNPAAIGPIDGFHVATLTNYANYCSFDYEIKDNIFAWEPVDYRRSYQDSRKCINLDTRSFALFMKLNIENNLCSGFGSRGVMDFEMRGMYYSGNYYPAPLVHATIYNNTNYCHENLYRWYVPNEPWMDDYDPQGFFLGYPQQNGELYQNYVTYDPNVNVLRRPWMMYDPESYIHWKNNVSQNCSEADWSRRRYDFCYQYAGGMAADKYLYAVDLPDTRFGHNISEDGSSVNPLFRNLSVDVEDRPAKDYRLTTSDTTARDQGLDLSADAYFSFADDSVGTARPQGAAWDIGYFEVIGGQPPAGYVPSHWNLRLSSPFNWNHN